MRWPSNWARYEKSTSSCTMKKSSSKSADALEHVAANHTGRAADSEHLGRIIRKHRRLSVQTFVRPAPSRVPIAGAVDELRVVQVDDARRGHIGPRRQFERRAQRPQEAGQDLGVVVQQHQIAPVRFAASDVRRAGETTVGVERNDPHLGEVVAHEIDGSVTRRVVDEDDLGCGLALRSHRLEAGTEPVPAVVRHDDDRDRGRWIQ